MRRSRFDARLVRTGWLIAALTLLGAIFLFAVGVDALEGRVDFQFYADSATYHQAARGEIVGLDTLEESVTVRTNFLGPLWFLALAGNNYYVVLLFNAALLFASIASIATSLRIDPLRFALLLLANPLTISSLLAVNKEFLALAFVALLLRALARGSLAWLVAAAVVSVLVRWQLLVFLLVLGAIATPLNPLRGRRRATLAVLLVGLSIAYAQLVSVFEPIRAALEASAGEYEGSGLHEWLQTWQDRGAYWLVFPIKAAHLLFSLGLHVERLVAPVDLYNDVWQLLHSTALLALFVALLLGKRLRLTNDLIYLSVIYMVVFALTPIYAPRYFYPVYILWAAALTPQFARVALLPPALVARRRRRRARPAGAALPALP